jgi:hypothetical protein
MLGRLDESSAKRIRVESLPRDDDSVKRAGCGASNLDGTGTGRNLRNGVTDPNKREPD